jgi:hypothetical protein
MTHNTNLLFAHKELLHENFLQTDLGILYQAIPFDALVEKIPSPKHSLSGRGCPPWFDVKGGVALQILKHYLGISDELLIERINTDWSMQLFCGISIKPTERIRDKNIVSAWRIYLGKHLDMEGLQKKFAVHWKPYMEHRQVGYQDATCYESGIRYPAEVKLLWECCESVYGIMQGERRILNMRKSRCNFERKKKLYLQYQRNRRKSRRKEKKLRKQLLKFLLRLTNLYNDFSIKHKVVLSKRKDRRMRVIAKVYEQQHRKAYGDKDEKIKDKIVSLYKPYVRPIVRGKEVKPVEFGAKVNKLQVNGISFIEHLSFDAFNETTRFAEGIFLQRKLFGKCTHQSGDAIYATNKNRTYARSQNIQTNFIPKGKQKAEHIEQARQMRTILNIERNTVLEGSFGNEKNHYLLQKSRARTQGTEICWIFFGMMTANISIIAQRMQNEKSLARAA